MRICVVAGLALLFCISGHSAVDFEDLRGSDWLSMSSKDKETFIYMAIGGLEKEGVFIMKTPHDYIQAIDKLLALDSEYQKEYLDNLVVFCIYDSEPQTREKIKQIGKNPTSDPSTQARID